MLPSMFKYRFFITQFLPFCLGLALIPCLLQLVILPCCPESPRFLLITKDQEAEAVKALQSLRGTSDVWDDIEEMRQEAKSIESEEKVM